ncbi:MAG: hypothetical protein ACKPJD_33390, partial [Planctomycetaceae bacterium]
MAASTAQTAASLQNSATTLDSGSWNDRLRTAAALLLSVGMAWVVWTDLRQPAAAVADNAEDSVDVDQLLREFETADQHSHKHDQQIQRMLAEPDLKSALLRWLLFAAVFPPAVRRLPGSVPPAPRPESSPEVR